MLQAFWQYMNTWPERIESRLARVATGAVTSALFAALGGAHCGAPGISGRFQEEQRRRGPATTHLRELSTGDGAPATVWYGTQLNTVTRPRNIAPRRSFPDRGGSIDS